MTATPVSEIVREMEAAASARPWEATTGVGGCPIIKDAEDKPVAVAENVALDLHHGWTRLQEPNARLAAVATTRYSEALKALETLAEAAEQYGDWVGEPGAQYGMELGDAMYSQISAAHAHLAAVRADIARAKGETG